MATVVNIYDTQVTEGYMNEPKSLLNESGLEYMITKKCLK